MRYTRYEYRRLNKAKLLVIFVVIIAISITIGKYIANIIYDNNIRIENNEDASNQKESKYNLIGIQCGYFTKEENAKEALSRVSEYCNGFIVEEEGKYRVLAGIYRDEDGMKKMEELKNNNIEVSKVKLNVLDDEFEVKEVNEVMDGLFTILNKLEEDDVKGIKTSEFKLWAKGIFNDGADVKSKRVEDLIIFIDSLPEEITKLNCNLTMQEAYKLMKN